MPPTSRLQLSLSAKDLKNLAGFMNVSDPFAVVTVRGDNPDNVPIVAGETEVVYNNLSPSWASVVIIDGYKFGVPFYIETGVFDFDAHKVGQKERDLAKKSSVAMANITGTEEQRDLYKTGRLPHKVMGTALFEVGELLAARGNVMSKSLQTGGAIYVHLEKSRDDQMGSMTLQFEGVNLSNTQRKIGKASPFFEMYRKVDLPTGAVWNSIYRSNVMRSNLNPKWDEVSLSLEAACNGDLDRAIKVVVWDHRRSGKHKNMGEFETNMERIHDAANTSGVNFFTLRRHDRDVGNIIVLKADLIRPVEKEAIKEKSPANAMPSAPSGIPESISVPERPEFLDYLSGGCQISLAVAIDFTASNVFNDYEKAIFAVGQVLAQFDSDKRYPVWGFGAKWGNHVRHCFQCGKQVEVHGVKGIIDCYRGVFKTPLTMSYPTVFTEVIRTASMYARHQMEQAGAERQLSYTILLILTAGNDEDIQETKRALIEASSSPLSVVIVGIGDADFSAMESLDEHDPHTEGGRDITKFVEFNEYNSYNALTAAVLDEIPDQLVDFYYEKGILPPKALKMNNDEVEVQPADDDERTVNFLG
jgi:hypothetical protein